MSRRGHERSEPPGMPKHTRIYTRTGDDGTTGMVGGQRIRKDAPRIETYGTVDELSTVVGIVRAELRPLLATHARAARLDVWLAWVQDALFNLGSDLATLRKDRWEGMPLIEASDAVALERAIDEADANLEPLNAFIHPGGCVAGALLHQARTVCRRAERLLIALRSDDDDVSEETVRFLNRLSDALFVWARWINADLDIPEYRWNPKTAPPL